MARHYALGMTMTQLAEAYQTSADPNRRRAIRRTIRRIAGDLTTEVARTITVGNNRATVRPTREGWAAVDVYRGDELMLGLSHCEMDEHDAIRTFARLVGFIIL